MGDMRNFSEQCRRDFLRGEAEAAAAGCLCQGDVKPSGRRRGAAGNQIAWRLRTDLNLHGDLL